METIKTIAGINKRIKEVKQEGCSVGLVPTMGYFHDGHISLIQKAREECDIVVISIFVNPLQFGMKEDFSEYPRNLEKDLVIAKKCKADIVFIPDNTEMYPEKNLTFVEVGELSECLCGKSRPGHFRGVTTVVAKLFNIIYPDKAYFGEKDFQQLIIIKKMVKDLNFNMEIIPVPLFREKDGLAMSSRNVYLSGQQRKSALSLFKAIENAKNNYKQGIRDKKTIISKAKAVINKEKEIKLEYMEIRDAYDFKPVEKIKGKAVLVIAAMVGKTRLIDNVILG
ncbi:MAG: pantoate--beta-alanine ligase [Actinomycetia bacterium]|nr:pantoate--beta-alanine ligase [Actinomycetes bacterium]